MLNKQPRESLTRQINSEIGSSSEQPASKSPLELRAEHYDSNNTAAPEPFQPQHRFIDRALYRCHARYTFWNNSPFRRIEHDKSCHDAKRHLEALGNIHDNVALTLSKQSRIFNDHQQVGAIFTSGNLTPDAAASAIEEFESRYCK
jgi:hypothetical protein